METKQAPQHEQAKDSPTSSANAPTRHRDDRPIWLVLAEMAAEVPEEESVKLPRDAAENLDHYLYGAPSVGDV